MDRLLSFKSDNPDVWKLVTYDSLPLPKKEFL